MALKKQILDIQAADGLAQKFDPRRLPTGKAAKAVNLVKTKNGSLTKRLGLGPLNGISAYGPDPFSLSTGVNLGTLDVAGYDNLYAIGRGTWTPTGAEASVLESYSDDLAGMIVRGPVPDLNIVLDAIVANTPGYAYSPCCAVLGDYLVCMWVAYQIDQKTDINTNQIYWCAVQVTTGQTVQGATLLDSGENFEWLRLVAIPGTARFVCCYSGASSENIYCQVATLASLTTSLVPWNGGSGPITLISDNTAFNGSGGPFDMRAVSNDSKHFAVAYQDGAYRSGTASVKVSYYDSTGALPGAPITWVVTSASSSCAQAFGLRSDGATSPGTNQTAVCYVLNNSPLTIEAAVGQTNANTTLCAPVAIYTGLSAGGIVENYPGWLDVAYCGNGGQLAGNNTWVCAHTPGYLEGSQQFGAVWNPLGTVGMPQENTGRVIDGNGTPGGASFTVDTTNWARIVQNQFQNVSGTLVPVNNTSGTNAVLTPGVTLASRGLEANGIVYYLGWVPSFTQGSFYALAFDQAANPTYTGPLSPMRPVGVLQNQTALADPGVGSNVSGSANVNAPNQWAGGSEWVSTGDQYGTSLVAYVASTQGQRLQPAYGEIQTACRQGYSNVQWGTVSAIGGALPSLFDGQNVFEQSFLWVPESVLVATGTTGKSGGGPTWTSEDDSYNWIFTWEQFDRAGNFHISARSEPVNITLNTTGNNYTQLNTALGGGSAPYTLNPTFYIPTLGVTNRMQPPGATNSILNCSAAAPQNLTLGVYRTIVNGLLYFRVYDRFFNGDDPQDALKTANLSPVVNAFGQGYVTFTDTYSDGELSNIGVLAAQGIQDGTHPLLYGDGSNGQPGALDNYPPGATPIQVRHKERLFASNGNAVQFTKQRNELVGPGYNPQVNYFVVGGDDPITGMASMDDKLVIFKENQVYYVTGDGPADDGSGNSFSPPQPIPTDSGCVSAGSVKSTPEGVYFMSGAGLRLVDRGLVVQYVGGPVEDELGTYDTVTCSALYPANNRLLICASTTDYPLGGDAQLLGEVLVRDYVLDAWTTMQVNNGLTPTVGFVSAISATASQLAYFNGLTPVYTNTPTIHFLDASGVVWREKSPIQTQAYYDNITYVGTTWITPMIRGPDQGRARCWDILLLGQSQDPHGLKINVGIDYGSPTGTRTWVWNTPGVPSITVGGVPPTPLTQVRWYDGRLGESFQVEVSDVVDTHTVSGEGFEVLGLTVTLGVQPGPYKLSPGSTQ